MTHGFIDNNCDNCHQEYEYDPDAAPEYCTLWCSRACAEARGYFKDKAIYRKPAVNLNENLTEQLEFCSILDDWYHEIKNEFKGQHPLGRCKEDLKSKVCEWIRSKNFEEENHD